MTSRCWKASCLGQALSSWVYTCMQGSSCGAGLSSLCWGSCGHPVCDSGPAPALSHRLSAHKLSEQIMCPPRAHLLVELHLRWLHFVYSKTTLQSESECLKCGAIRSFISDPHSWSKMLIQSQAECGVIVLVLIQAANWCFALLISDWLVGWFVSSFPAESKGQNNPVFKDYLPGSSDLPEENKPVEPTSLWKQASHTHNLPPGLEYLNQVLNLSKC